MKHFPPRQRFNSHYIHVLILIEFNTILQRLCDTWTVLYTPKPRIDATSFLCCAASHWILIYTSGGRGNILDSKESFMNNEWITRELLSFLALSCEVKAFLTRVDDIIHEQFASFSSTLGWLSSSTSSAFIECSWCLSFVLLGISHWLPYCWSIVGVLVDFVKFFMSSTIYRLVRCQWHFWVVKYFFGHLAFFVKLSANPSDVLVITWICSSVFVCFVRFYDWKNSQSSNWETGAFEGFRRVKFLTKRNRVDFFSLFCRKTVLYKSLLIGF